MKCYYHTDRDAVATCQVCGKTICEECVSTNNVGMCPDCFAKYLRTSYREEKRYFIFHTILGIGLAVLGVYLLGEWWGIAAFFLSFGWYKKTEQEHLEDSIWLSGNAGGGYLIGMILMFPVKVALCAVLGLPLFIKKLVIFIQDTKIIKEYFSAGAQEQECELEVAA